MNPIEQSSITNENDITISNNFYKENKDFNFSKMLKNPSETHLPSLPPKRQREFCQVEFAYSPQNDDELQLNVGDIIAIVSKEAQDIGWWKGEIGGKTGMFPDNFVKPFQPEGIYITQLKIEQI